MTEPTEGTGRWVDRHPLIVVVVGAGLVAIGQAIWIWTHRRVGAIDPDEAGYIGTALRFHRLFGSEPLALPRAIGGTGYAPLVPLVSVPLLWLGPDDARTVMLTLPLLMVVTAVCVAGITNRLAGPRAAMVAGLLFGAFPTVVFATQTYWFGLGAAAAMAGALWALLASERLTNRWTYAFGACIAAMLLARTMTLGYLPAVVGAGLVIAGRERKSWIGLVKAGAVVLVLAAPWYVAARHAVFDYLFSYGYGERAALFGEGGPGTRFVNRLDRLHADFGTAWWIGILAVVLAACWLLVDRRRSGTRGWRSGWPPATRDALAMSAAAALSLAALTSTKNNGVWFELPLVAVLVALVVAAGSRLPWPAATALSAPVAVAAVLQLACSWWWIAPDGGRVPFVAARNRFSQYEPGFAEYDRRFLPTRRDEQTGAARDWWALSSDVERELHRITGGHPATVMVTGNFELFNSNTVQLAGELEGWTVRARVPDTVTDRDGRAVDLTPTFAGGTRHQQVERILVVALHRQHLFTPDVRVREYYREARAAGWQVRARFDIPGGGRVLVLRHPEGRPEAAGR